ESTFFIEGGSCPVFVSGCECASPYSGTTRPQNGLFVRSNGYVVLDCCRLNKGISVNITGSFIMNNCDYDPSAVFANLYEGSPNKPQFAQVTPKPTKTITSTAYTIQPWDAAYKLLFNCATAQTITIDTTNNFNTGAMIEAQQTGTGKVTFKS